MLFADPAMGPDLRIGRGHGPGLILIIRYGARSIGGVPGVVRRPVVMQVPQQHDHRWRDGDLPHGHADRTHAYEYAERHEQQHAAEYRALLIDERSTNLCLAESDVYALWDQRRGRHLSRARTEEEQEERIDTGRGCEEGENDVGGV